MSGIQAGLLVLVVVAWVAGWGQEIPGMAAGEAAPLNNASAGVAASPTNEKSAVHPAEALYLRLRSVGLDTSRVYRARDVSFDRAAFHITFEDGTIAFTENVAGRVTGAFFEGDGEVLLIPPDKVERASMARSTGAAILEERFATAYFRFNDDTFEELQPSLLPSERAQEFVTQWNQTAQNLAEEDALRLLVSFSQLLPTAAAAASPADVLKVPGRNDRLVHARIQGRKLGVFDLYFDSQAAEQIWAGQLKSADGVSYYDVWASFAINPRGRGREAVSAITAEGGAPDTVGIARYTIRADVKPPTELSAQALLELHVRQSGQRTLLFELSRYLQVKQVEVDGHSVEFIHNQALEGTQLSRRGNDLVAVVFPEVLQSGQRLELRFEYGGEVLSDAGGGLLYVGARGTWYPNRGLAMASFDLEFHYPPGWTLLATGRRTNLSLGSSGRSTPGEQVGHWISDRPIPLAGFNLGKYSRATARAGTVTVETYAASGMERAFPRPEAEESIAEPQSPPRSGAQPMVAAPFPPSPARNAQPVADAAAQAVEFFSQRFGPYPYTSLELTQMPGSMSQGWPGLVFLSSVGFLNDEEKTELHMSAVNRALSKGVIAHETAHQWWGDLVMWNGYRDQWMMEALANYSSLMLLEAEDPPQFHAVMEKYRNDLLDKNKQGLPLMEAGPVTLGVRLSCSQFPNGYEAISYGRGTWLFHMLRYMLRDGTRKNSGRATGPPVDEPFVQALHKIRDRYQGKSITTEEMLRTFEEELPPSLWYEGHNSLDWFYEGWVNGTDIPRLELQAMKYVDKAGSTAISGTVLQKDASKDLVTSVPLFAVTGGKATLVGRIFADGPETQFHLAAPLGTRKVVLDPNGTLLLRNH